MSCHHLAPGLISAAGFLVSAIICGPAAARDDFGAKASRVFSALDSQISVSFEEDPLQDVGRSLGRRTKIRVTLDVKSIREAGIEPAELLITYSARNRSLRSVLGAVLDHRFGWTVQEDGLTITTARAAADNTTIRRYSVASFFADGCRRKPLVNAFFVAMAAPPTKIRMVAIRDSVAFVRGSRADQQRVTRMFQAASIARQPKRKARRKYPFGPDLHRSVPAEVRIARELASNTVAEFDSTPLKDCVEFFGDLHNIQIILDESALEMKRIRLNAPVCLKVKNVTLLEALDRMNAPLGLDFIVADEVLQIMPKEAAAERREICVYRLAKSIDAVRLAKRIKSSIAPGSWKGTRRIVALPRTLVVWQSQPVQRAIAKLFRSAGKK